MKYSIYAILISLVILSGCASKPDPAKEMAMGLDGGLFVWEPGPAVAFVAGYEFEGQYKANGIQIVFPMQRRTARPLPGLEVFLGPDLPTGQEMEFGGRTDSVWVIFRPSSARPQPDGLLVGYDSGVPGGQGRLVLEVCEAWPGGRIKGKLLYAKLRSTVYSQEQSDVVPSRNPSFLELWNWPFELELIESPYQ